MSITIGTNGGFGKSGSRWEEGKEGREESQPKVVDDFRNAGFIELPPVSRAQ
jgi:hypothetical protein